MGKSMVIKQYQREYTPDRIFGANALAQEAVAKYGKENVTIATIGAILDEEENHVFLSSVEKAFREMSGDEISKYAPIAGLPEYLEEVEKQCFGAHRPAGHIRAVGVTGGSGGIHHLIHVYSEVGDEILTADWHWGAYGTLCEDQGRKLATYEMLTADQKFNIEAFRNEVERLAKKQENLVIIINTPAHNPTGYSLSDGEWDDVLNYLKELVARGENKVILGVDVAYLDFAGEKNEVRAMFEKLGNLPESILATVIYSMSKGYTLYGQRVGALIGISSSKAIAEEFFNACSFSSRGTWSNISRVGMKTLVELAQNPEKQAAYEQERDDYYKLIRERADIFMQEAKECGLQMVPYHGGFFLSIPTDNSDALCSELHKDNIFIVPLKKGARVAICAVPKKKIYGLAGKIKLALDKVEA